MVFSTSINATPLQSNPGEVIPLQQLPISFTKSEQPVVKSQQKQFYISHLNKTVLCDDFGDIQKCNINGQISIFEGLNNTAPVAVENEVEKRSLKPHYWNYGTPNCTGWHLDSDRRLTSFYGPGTTISVEKGTKTGGSKSANVGLSVNALGSILGLATGVTYVRSWEISDNLSAGFAPVPANHTGALILNAFVNTCSGMAVKYDRCSQPKVHGEKPYSGTVLRDNGGKPDGEYRIHSG
ncbi:hypothetical protein HDV02_005491, partial [Globomyces sp. JEL0801]